MINQRTHRSSSRAANFLHSWRRRSLGGGLHEVRTDLAGKRTARLFVYIDRRQRLVVLHGIVKKTRKTPAADLALARANKGKHERSIA